MVDAEADKAGDKEDEIEDGDNEIHGAASGGIVEEEEVVAEGRSGVEVDEEGDEDEGGEEEAGDD